MTLLVDELYNGIVFEQNFRIQKSISIAHIRPWIYKHGALQSGVFTCEVLEGSTVLKTGTIAFTDINTAIPATYGHGQIRFDMNSLQLNHNTNNEWTEYKLKFYISGYTNAATFLGLVRRYELKIYDTYGQDVLNNEAPNDMVESLGFEVFEYNYR